MDRKSSKPGFVPNFVNYAHISFCGLLDALSLHKTLPTLVNNTETVYIILKIFGANVGLIVGSEMLFRRGIAPFMETINEQILDLKDANQYNSLLYLIYQALWLVPICVLCYVCCLAWYQELADSIEKFQNKDKKKDAKNNNPIVSLQNGIYGFLTWLFAFLQVQLLTVFFPGSIRGFLYVLEEILKQTVEGPAYSSLQLLDVLKLVVADLSLKRLISTALYFLLLLLQLSSYLCGFVLMAILYSWYAFDPKWVSLGKNPNERFSLIEKYFFYFLGFGTPFVILNKTTSFIIGFATFLTIFPFCIILGSVLDYTESYVAYDMKETKPVRVFKTAQVWTLSAMKMIGKEPPKKVSSSGKLDDNKKKV